METKNSSHGSLRCSLDGSADGFIISSLIKTSSKIHNGYVRSGHTEGHSGELSVELRNDLSYSLGCSSGRWDDVVACSTSSTPVLLGRSVHSLLGGSHSVNSGHETLNDTKLVVNNLGKGSKTVGGTGSIGYNVHGRIILFLVDSHNKHGSISRRGRDYNLLGTTSHVCRSLGSGGEDSGRLDDVVGSSRSPLNLGGVHLSKHLDCISINAECFGLGIVRDFSMSTSVNSIVFVHVLHVIHRDEGIVDSNNVHLRVVLGSSHDEATNTSKSIDSDID
mmetsp:Transcript_16019/g.30225  ORF Transcript_16019/g.30225 Transcript_16019/m.30225 type:complete len:277 (-) Transcript_16019:163-993(-)